MSAANAIANAVATFATGSMQLKDLITQVRKAKTAAEEREIIKKESAFLRNAFGSKGDKFKARNLVKLMYIHMLGYPTQFGQLECLKLITQGTYADKRVGYLALMILLDERAETLMLVTNSMKNDLNHFQDHWIIINALTAMGNICSAGMASDLASDVEHLMSKKYLEDKGVSLAMQNHIRKKALFAACRVLRKQPDLLENFKEPAKAALADRNHAVVLAGVTLMLQILALDETGAVKKEYSKQVPALCLILDQLHISRFNAEYDVNQINNPFLQVKILKLLGKLGAGDAEATELMTDILSKVAASRGVVRASNTASAIAYQCVTTIMQIEPVKSLRTHAVNICGNFLKMPNNNMRYVALNTLVQAVAVDASAVQRHRNVVVECVKDSDVSIRRRALDLIYALVNQDNITTLAKELLSYLAVTDVAFKPALTERICVLVQKFAVDNRWYIDSMLTVMVQAGQYVKDSVMRAFVVKVSNCEVALQAYATRAAYAIVTQHKDSGSDALLTTALWLLGEYGELLLAQHAALPDEAPFAHDGHADVESALVAAVQGLAASTKSTEVQAYAIIAAMKLSGKLPASASHLKALLQRFTKSQDQEVQQRCCEILNIITHNGGLPPVLSERIPVLDEKLYAGNLQDSAMLQAPDASPKTPAAPGSPDLLGDLLGPADAGAAAAPPPPGPVDMLGDLDDLLGGPAPAAATGGAAGGLDMLDMLGAPAPAAPAPAAPSAAPAAGSLDLFGDFTAPAAPATTYEPITAWSEDGVTITFNLVKTGRDGVDVNATYVNRGPQPVLNFAVQAALPKSMSVQMLPQEGGTTLGAHGSNTLTQKMMCVNGTEGAKPLAMRLRISYTLHGEDKVAMAQVNNFPAGL